VLELGQAGHGLPRVPGHRQQVAGVFEESLAGGSQLNATSIANEQRGVEFLLKTFDLLAERGLNNAGLHRRLGKTTLPGDFHEVFELIEIHNKNQWIE